MAQKSLPQPASQTRPFAVVDYLLAALLGLAAAALYLRTLAPGLLGGDSGEFQFAAWLGGFAHPTGYPLYLLLGYLWAHLLPLHDPAWRMNAFSALWAAIAVSLTYWVSLYSLALANWPARAGTRERVLAVLGALTLAASPTFWSQSVIAEVYSLNAALIAGILLAALIWAGRALDKREDARQGLLAVALLLGLGLAHHRTALLLVPALLLFWWRVRRRAGKSGPWRASTALASLLLVCLPFLLYLYIPLRAPGAPYARVEIGPEQTLNLYQADLPGFVRYVTGQGFSGELLGVSQAASNAGTALNGMAAELTVPGLLLAAVGLLWITRRFQPLAALTAVAFATLVAFNLFYGIGDIKVFYIPAYLLATLWLVMGAAACCEVVASATHRWGANGRPGIEAAAAIGVAFAALILPAYLAAAHFGPINQSDNLQVGAGWHELLKEPIPPDAILVSNDRDEMTPLLYSQHVEGLRPDLTGLFPLLGPAEAWGDVGQVIDTALRSGRPVLLVKPMPGLEVKYRLEPAGRLVRVLGPAVDRTPQRPRATVYGGALRLNGFDLRPGTLAPSSQLSVGLYWQPLATLNADYATFVHIVNADGVMIAQDDHHPGGEYYPSHLWRPGELVSDVHSLTLPAELGRGPYHIVAGVYTKENEIEHLGRPEEIGMIGIARPADVLPADLQYPLAFTFDNQLALDGYEMQLEGDVLSLRLFWQALHTPDVDYTLFVHVLDETGKIVAQSDQQPATGEMPTSTWPRGYILADRMDIRLPAGLSPGVYRLEAGAYDPATVIPLAAQNNQGRPVGASVPLGEFRKLE